MRPLLLLGLLLPVLLPVTGCNPRASEQPIHRTDEADMLVIGHRGASAYAPEHTFASWDLALEMGADYLEQDLQMTKDGVLVVLHDDTLDRTTAGMCTGRVIDHTLAELRACDVGSWFNAAYPSRAEAAYGTQRIATLDEVLARYAGRASFYIETKNPEEAPGMEEALLRLLDEHDLLTSAAAEWRVLIQSFSERSLRLIHSMDPSLPLIQLRHARGSTPRTLEGDLATIAEYAVGIGPSFRDVDARLVAAADGLCLAVHPYTVNDPAVMSRMTDAGVHGMFTDVPDTLLALRPADEPRGRAATAAAAKRHRACVERRDSARSIPR